MKVDLNALFKGLNDPTRREILELLKEKDRTAGEIADHFDISKPSISHHLDLLRQAGLVVSVKEGQFIFYSLNTTVMDEMLKWILSLQAQKDKKNIIMKKFTPMDGAALVVWLLPLAYLCYVYPAVPQIVPVHYGINGTVDRYGSKAEFLTGPFIMIGVSALVYLLLKFLPAIDPKKQIKYGESTFQKLALGMVVFLAALDIAIVYATVHKGFEMNKVIFPIIGLLFAFIGNMMYSIKPNYFAGIRTPWTLESEDNWRATHRLAGTIWFIGGIALTVLMLFLPPAAGTIIFTSCVLVMAFTPMIYSFIYFKTHGAN